MAWNVTETRVNHGKFEKLLASCGWNSTSTSTSVRWGSKSWRRIEPNTSSLRFERAQLARPNLQRAHAQLQMWSRPRARPRYRLIALVDIRAFQEQTVCMGKAGSAVSGIFGFIVRNSAPFAEH